MNRISKLLAICCIAVLLAGCEEPTPEEIMKHVNATGMLTDKQAESLSKIENIDLSGLTSITNEQAEILSEVEILVFDGLTSITDEQAESFSSVWQLHLNGLPSITDEQAESLSKVRMLYISEALQPLIDKYKKQ
ncbi:MAG: hypothetical protein CMM03_00060 [Rhodopirellula sp.]|nr:hypothetical protein [Rhodopirellula sp.]|tara:strand:+ start:297 stop:701 length:405 start_codon:yes stop_codon:yes gene_type:complete